MLAREIAIGFGVAVVFPMLIYYGVSTFIHPPTGYTYHREYVNSPKLTPEENQAAKEGFQRAESASIEAERVFSLLLICVAAPLGYIAMVLGSLLPISGFGVGLMFGGIFAVIHGYWSHWSYLEDWVRFVSLLVAMAVLTFIAYRQLPSGRQTQPPGSDNAPAKGR